MPVNPLFNILGGNVPQNNFMSLIQQFQMFKSLFRGDPKQQIQMLLNSGQISQEQYNNAVKMATELQKYLR